MSLYAVNGKTPIAAWIPSRDDAGNGTTTLTDLVGSNNGTLTNFALTGSTSNWVADTGAGGIRALDFDGTNDFVTTNAGSILRNGVSNDLTFSLWVNNRETGRSDYLAWKSSDGQQDVGILQTNQNAATFNRLPPTNANVNIITSSTGSVAVNQWSHIVVTKLGTGWSLYINGSLSGTATLNATLSSHTTDVLWLGSNHNAFSPLAGFNLNGRLDDIRIFNVALNSTDVADLWNGGNGRGIIPGGTTQTQSRRRRDLGGFGL
jgi:hypothetical protein